MIDIRKLYATDRSRSPTTRASPTCRAGSKITYIDGDEGVLLYRGYNIAELAEKSRPSWRACYLLLNGELPTKPQKRQVRSRTSPTITVLHEQISTFLFRGFRRDAHPMAVMLRRGWRPLGLLSRPPPRHTRSVPAHGRVSYRLIAKMPTIAAMAYKYSVEPTLRVSCATISAYAGQFPKDDVPAFRPKTLRGEPDHEKCHGPHLRCSSADHEQNASIVDRASCRFDGRPIRLPALLPASPACGARPWRRQPGRDLKMLKEIGSVKQKSAELPEDA